MPFCPCPSGCGCFLSADDGHDRCLQCLGFQHAEDAFVDDSCACCGRMSMISLRSRLYFMKGLAPSAATRAGLSGSSRGLPADALGGGREVGVRILNYLDDWLILAQSREQLSDHRDLVLQHQKEQALPRAENLFSRCGVRLGEYDGTPHGGTCPSSAELPEFLQRQECGTTKTVSEAPGAYGICSCSHAARIVSYETTSALATLPGPEVGMAPQYTATVYPQPLDRPCLSTGRGAPRTSVPAYCCHNRCLQHGLGRYMQRAGSLGALDRPPTALAHQLPGAVGSAFSLAAVRPLLLGKHVLVRGVARPFRDDPADLESIRGSSGRPVCLPRVLPLPAVLLPD